MYTLYNVQYYFIIKKNFPDPITMELFYQPPHCYRTLLYFNLVYLPKLGTRVTARDASMDIF